MSSTGAIFIRISYTILLCSCPSELSGAFNLGMSFIRFGNENVIWWYFSYIVTRISTQKSVLHKKKLQVCPLSIMPHKWVPIICLSYLLHALIVIIVAIVSHVDSDKVISSQNSKVFVAWILCVSSAVTPATQILLHGINKEKSWNSNLVFYLQFQCNRLSRCLTHLVAYLELTAYYLDLSILEYIAYPWF